MRIARTFLAVALMSVFPTDTLSFATVVSGPTCTLACCAGRAPHVGGSCMNGSCHAYLNPSRSHIQHGAVHQSEEVCGLSSLTMRLYRSRKTHALGLGLNSDYKRAPSKSFPDPASLISSTLGKPCASDCGAGTPSSNNQRRPRETGAPSFAGRHRPLTGSRIVSAEVNLHSRDPRYRVANPRAPPKLIS